MKTFIITVVAMIMMAGCGVSARSAEPMGKVVGCSTLHVDQTAKKGISLPCLDQKSTINFNALRGPVIVNVWGSWCAPCLQELPYFVKLAATKKVQIVGVDVEERSMDKAKTFLIAHGLTWPMLYDPDARTKSLFGFGVPVTWFIDKSGVVKYKQIGTIHSYADLTSMANKYLGVKI
jgi:cytochrome c biogenesis protein CcmG, thiol:disulfide interchange protein DsbE